MYGATNTNTNYGYAPVHAFGVEDQEAATLNQPFLSSPFEKYRVHRRVILPTAPWVWYWDWLVFAALVWTATGTVYDVMVISAKETNEIMSYPIRTTLLDVIFVADTVFTCFRAYRTQNGRGRLVTDLETIQNHYIYSKQFVIDVLACIPFDALAKLFDVVFNITRAAFYFKMLSLLRMLRLGRLFRKIRQSKNYLKLERDYNSSVVVLIQLFIFSTLIIHWMACIWVWIGIEENAFGYNELTWLSRMDPPRDIDTTTSGELYLISLYWSVTTVTTIGYGDITPGTIPEFAAALILEFLGAFVFTYAIGTVSGAISVMEQNRIARREKLDSLNSALKFTATDKFDRSEESTGDLGKYDVRRYRAFTHRLLLSREYKKRKAFEAIDDVLSPGLRNSLLFSYYHQTLKCARLFKTLSKDELKQVAAICRLMSFPDREIIAPHHLNCIGIVQRGVGSRCPSKRILAPGSVFGQDTFALSLMRGRGDIETHAEEDCREIKVMTFFQVLTIDYAALKELCDRNPSLHAHFRYVALRLMLVRWARSIVLREKKYAPLKTKSLFKGNGLGSVNNY